MALRTMATHRITFYRPSETFLDGEFVQGGGTSLGEVEGSLQPLVQGSRYGEIVKLGPEGYDSESTYLFITKQKLQAYSLSELHKSDYCNLDDGKYKIMQVSNWNIPTFSRTAHYVYILIKAPSITRQAAEI